MERTRGDNPIRHACEIAGVYTLSIGTSDPAVVLPRLLDALAILAPEAHRAILAPDGEYAAIPADALQDESSSWWGSSGADALLQRVFGSINAAAPEGFACMFSGNARIELARIEVECTVDKARSAPPPSVSALRARAAPQA